MKFIRKKPELLAPAGDFECLRAAINAGADAVYFGLQEFNMRARARNFKISDLPKIARICKPQGVKKYLTLNTIIYDGELKEVEKIIKKVKPYVDAVICSDMSVMMLCRKHGVGFHVSTQCSVSNSKTADFYKRLGAQRITLARELSLKQIKKIAKVVPVEIFIIGKTTGILRCKIKSMEINKKSVDKVRKGQDVAIKLPKCRKGDEVYLIVKTPLTQ